MRLVCVEPTDFGSLRWALRGDRIEYDKFFNAAGWLPRPEPILLARANVVIE